MRLSLPARLRWAAAIAVVAAAIVVVIVLARRDEPVKAVHAQYPSRPDLAPPRMRITGTADAKVFLAPKVKRGQSGAMILDADGELVWFRPFPKGIDPNDFKVQRYQGRPVLTWWEGKTNPKGYGQGEWVIADASYREIARVQAGNGRSGDLHELQLTPEGTALITIYAVVDADLSSVGSSKAGQAVDSIVQEIDVATGAVKFEWRSLDHIPLADSHARPSPTQEFPFDYFHINSIAVDTDGDLLVSGRNVWAIYKIDRKTGDVIWRLGGRRSDLKLGKGVRFAWQHDARRQPDGTLTLFDNESSPKAGERSRLLTLRLDHKRKTARLIKSIEHPEGLLADAEGNVQHLPNGNLFAGWGLGRQVSQQAPDGRLLFGLKLPATDDTYRAFTFEWTGRPTSKPAVVATRDDGRVTALASWNGATEVTSWQLLAGEERDALSPVATATRSGFETSIATDADAEYVAVRALAGTTELATSEPVAVR